jgi:uncharacterized membrane protein YdjX (TVP38/TMEM64 family)
MTPDAEPARSEAKTTFRRWPAGPLAVVLLLAVGAAAFWFRDVVNLAFLVDRREALRGFVEASPWTAALIYVAGYALAIALSIPGAAVLTVAGGFAFGWQMGAPLALIAATAGGTAFFVLARGTVGRLMARKAGARARSIAAGFRADAFSYFLFLRLVPLFPFWIVNLAAALAALPLRIFVAATLIGSTPVALALSIAGAGLDSVVSEQITQRERCRQAGREPCPLELHVGTLLSPSLLIALGAIGCLALIPVAARRFGRRPTGEAAQDAKP